MLFRLWTYTGNCFGDVVILMIVFRQIKEKMAMLN